MTHFTETTNILNMFSIHICVIVKVNWEGFLKSFFFYENYSWDYIYIIFQYLKGKTSIGVYIHILIGTYLVYLYIIIAYVYNIVYIFVWIHFTHIWYYTLILFKARTMLGGKGGKK